jgi:hypothetical protein
VVLQQVFEGIPDVSRRESAAIMKTNIIAQTKAISPGTFFRREFRR